jgi:hypothetical protein
VAQIVVEKFEQPEWRQLAAMLVRWTETGCLKHIALLRIGSHISDSISTSGEEAHGNACTALCRSSCRIADLGTLVSDKQSKQLFSAAQ